MKPTLISLMSAILLCFLVNARGEVSTRNVEDTNFTKIRMDFASRPGYEPTWQSSDERNLIRNALKDRKFSEVIRLGRLWLKKVPVDAEVYLMIAMAEKELGDFKGYCDDIAMFYGFLKSITESGDGKTQETAFKVISVDEEYFLLREVGAKLNVQSLVGHCDKMDVERRDGNKYTIYFDVSISLKAMNALLGGTAKESSK